LERAGRDGFGIGWFGNSEDSQKNQKKAQKANQQQAPESVHEVMDGGDRKD
jgi:hypothetical protein